MDMNKQEGFITIVSAVLDTKRLTLYREDGSTIFLPQGSPQIQEILGIVVPQNSVGKPAHVPTHLLTAGYRPLTEMDLKALAEYNTFEKNSGGLVKFFKVATKKLQRFFHKSPTESPVQDVAERIAEVLANAEPVSEAKSAPVHALGADKGTIGDSESTMVAVVDGNQVVTDVQGVMPHIIKANKDGRPASVINLLRRFLS